jgi:hypothetical protein|tara:strand:+ start:203 stop:361 length:159 start_codon:yes stop_codon:yes gene_type:complete
MSKRFTIPLEVDEFGEFYLSIPDNIIEELGWEEGEVINYNVEGENFVLTKND